MGLCKHKRSVMTAQPGRQASGDRSDTNNTMHWPSPLSLNWSEYRRNMQIGHNWRTRLFDDVTPGPVWRTRDVRTFASSSPRLTESKQWRVHSRSITRVSHSHPNLIDHKTNPCRSVCFLMFHFKEDVGWHPGTRRERGSHTSHGRRRQGRLGGAPLTI